MACEYPPADTGYAPGPTETDDVPPMRLQNVVTKLTTSDKKIDLAALVRCVPMFEMKKTFPAAICRLSYPKAVLLVFSSGMVVCTGALTEHKGEDAIRAYADILREFGVPNIRIDKLELCNTVTAAHCNFPINVLSMHRSIPCQSSFDPDRFPGASFKVQELLPASLKKCAESVCITLFVSGTCTMQGATSESDAAQIWDYFFRKYLFPVKGYTGNTSSKQPHIPSAHKDQTAVQAVIDAALVQCALSNYHTRRGKKRKLTSIHPAIEE